MSKGIPKSLAKSACQKNIRRGNVESALRCAKENIETDALDFSRRVMVLAPEEVSIHPLLIDVVEINKRLSKKGEVATDHDKDVMLTIVRDIAKATKRDIWEYRNLDFNFVITKDMFDYFSKWQQDILTALKYRGSIGGMKGDLAMFEHMPKYLAQMWSEGQKYSYDMFYDNLDEPLVDNRQVCDITPKDIPYFAADFHCCPFMSRLCLYKPKWVNGEKVQEPTEYKKLIDTLKGKTDVPVKSVRQGDTDDDEWVKKIMWLYASSVSFKKDFRNGKMLDSIASDGVTDHDRKIFDKCFEVLAPIWESAATWYINKCFEKE